MIIPKVIKRGQCPYCYDGEVIRDTITKSLICNRCLKKVGEY